MAHKTGLPGKTKLRIKIQAAAAPLRILCMQLCPTLLAHIHRSEAGNYFFLLTEKTSLWDESFFGKMCLWKESWAEK